MARVTGFERLARTSLDAVLIVDADGRVAYGNDRAADLAGLPAGDLPGLPLERIAEADSGADLCARLSVGRCAGDEPVRFESRLCRGDGVGFPVLVSAARIRHAGGPAVLAVVRDLSERDRAERALRRAEDLRRRGEQLAYVGELAARLNHEIKNPLATVRAGLEVLDRELELGEDHAQVLDTVIQEIRNVNRLVSSLLGVARPERMEPATHDLVELAREALDPFRPVARRKGIDMVLTGPSEALPVVVDDRAFHRLLGNLLMNALDVLGNRGRIEVICRVAPAAEVERHLPGCRGSVAAVAVIDDGPGIPPAVFEQLFDPFFTTKSSGTGLGLPVARDIVEAHGGALVVRSRPGEGAAFEAFLPGPGSAPRGCGFDAGAPDVED